MIQYYDAWEEYTDPADIRDHDAKLIRDFNFGLDDQHSELITNVDEESITDLAISQVILKTDYFDFENFKNKHKFRN